MAFPRSGCQPCKSRRKKCDGSFPVCQRCAKAKRVCFGTRLPFSEVHDENDFASGRRKRPRGPRSRPEPPPDANTSLSRDVQAEAVAYYMHQHLEPIKDASNLIESPREALLSTWSSSPDVREAVSAIALALFSRTRQCSIAAVQSITSYKRSLRTLQEMLNTLSADHIESCLLTICLVSRYEDAVLPTQLKKHASLLEMRKGRLHSLGIVAVLDYWRKLGNQPRAPTETVKYARRLVRKAALFGRIDLPDWLRDGRQFGERDHEQAFDSIIVRIIGVRPSFASLLDHQDPSQSMPEASPADTEVVLREIQEIDEALVKWIEQIPGKKQRVEHQAMQTHNHTSSPFYRNIIYSYHNHAYAAMRAQYYGYRILIRTMEMRMLHSRDSKQIGTDIDEAQKCAEILNDLAKKLASTIPFCLEQFNPPSGHGSLVVAPSPIATKNKRPYISELVVSPLLFASTTSCIDAEARLWFKRQLADVGRLLGYGILELVAKSDFLKL